MSETTRAAAATQPIVVLISGRGSNMLTLVDHGRRDGSAYRVVRVLADQPLAVGLPRASALGIDTVAVAPPMGPSRPRPIFERELAAGIDAAQPALIVLAGFMRILSDAFVARYAGRMLNIHPSLLPAYPGLHTHRRVLEAGERHHGSTVHFVTAELDGGPAVIQCPVDVLPTDDEAALAARVQAGEHAIYPLAVQWYCAGRLRCKDGRAWLDGVALETPLQYPLERARIVLATESA